MSIAETLLVLGTFGICTGVWVTLAVIMSHNRKAENVTLQNDWKSVREYKLKEIK